MRNRYILIVAAVVLLAAAVFTYFSLSGHNTPVDIEKAAEGSTAVGDGSVTGVTSDNAETAAVEPTVSTALTEPEIIRSEEIEIKYNSPEYDLKASLCEDSAKRTFVRLEYYLDGAGTAMEAASDKLPELDGIFQKRDEAGTASGAFKIKYAYLNPGLSKVYLQISGGSKAGFEETFLYRLDLKDFSVKRLFSSMGKFSEMLFTKDFTLLGYSFDDPPYLSIFQENSLFDILDCKSDEFKVRGSRTLSGKIAGADRDPAYVYDYTFVAWQSNTVARLKQAAFKPKDPYEGLSGQTEVLYDVEKDLFTNLDGSPVNGPSTTPDKGAEPADKGGTEAVKVLTDFYSLLPSEKNYKAAMNLLDESFSLQLDLLRQFGVTEILKSDIDSDTATMYSDILKAAKLDSIVKTELSGGIYTVYYYQTLSLNADSQVRQPLSAQIRKVKDTYKIILIKDADGEKQPFSG